MKNSNNLSMITQEQPYSLHNSENFKQNITQNTTDIVQKYIMLLIEYLKFATEKIVNIIFIRLVILLVIFYLKHALEFYSTLYNFDLPDYLRIYDVRNSRFYIAKHEITFLFSGNDFFNS